MVGEEVVKDNAKGSDIDLRVVVVDTAEDLRHGEGGGP